MHQLNVPSLAPSSANSIPGQGAAANPQTSDTQKFSSHLNTLTEQLDARRSGNSSRANHAREANAELSKNGAADREGQAVSDLARAILHSADGEDMPADEAWLSMVEELNAVAEGEVSLAQISSRHGIDVEALEAQLSEALAEFDGDLQALIAELKQISSGKTLPPASATQNQITIAERPPLQELFDKLAQGEDIEALLSEIKGLSAQEQAQFAADVDALLSKLQGQTDDSQALAAELKELSKALKSQLHDMLAVVSGLTEQEQTHLQQQLALLEQLDDSTLQNIRALESELNRLLNSLENELEGVKPSELMATLETQLEALKSQQLAPHDANSETKAALEHVNRLLSELSQKLEVIQADTRVVDGSREHGSGLSAVAQALSLASKELRAQLQQQVQKTADGEASEDFIADFDNLRRLLSESSTHGSEQRHTTSQSQLGTSFQSALQGAQTTTLQGNGASRERAADVPSPSGFEAARQAQQAIDILGTGGTERLRERVSLMFNSRTQAAEMRLDPPDLGRLNIRLNLSQEQATVSFQVTTPQAREAIEQSLPRLREMLAEQGIALADANVSEEQQNGSQQASTHEGQKAQLDGNGLSDNDFDSEAEIEVAPENAVIDGRVDYFV